MSGSRSIIAPMIAAVKAGRLSPRDLVAESLRRIDEINSRLNAVVMLRGDAALAEAERVDRDLPLAGLPILVKDIMPVAGMRNTCGGFPLFADAPPGQVDDVVVAKLRRAGAIVVGRSNAPSFGHIGVTVNPLYGATRNPWNLERSPGGSSGGAAAALASGMVLMATSSDAGGSTRSPASYCGLVGYKPTLGLFGRSVPMKGITVSSAGAMNACVADVRLEAEIMAGPSRGDIHALPRNAVALTSTRPSKVIAVATLRQRCGPQTRRAFEAACDLIERDLRLPVHRIEQIDTGALEAFEIIYDCELAERLLPWRSRWDEFEPSLRMCLEHGINTSLTDYIAAQRKRFEVAALLEAHLGSDHVLITPVKNADGAPLIAAPQGPAEDDPGVDALKAEISGAGNTMDFNMAGLPALSVPMGLDMHGVPIGLQIAAPRFCDGYAFWLAERLEEAKPWPLTATGYAPFQM